MRYAAVRGQPRLSALATPARLTNSTPLIKASATITDYRRHRRTLSYCPWFFPCSLCAYELFEIIFFMKSGRIRTELWTLAPEVRHAPLHTATKCVDHWASWTKRLCVSSCPNSILSPVHTSDNITKNGGFGDIVAKNRDIVAENGNIVAKNTMLPVSATMSPFLAILSLVWTGL